MMKGYSVTASGRGTKPRHAMKLAEPNVACSPFEDAVRISGIFELGGRDLSVNRRLLDGVLRSASVFLRDWVVEEPRFEWAGMRPTTPDDLPLISAVPGFGHLYVATGHGMLGVTLAPATAVALAPLVLEDRTVPELEPFRLDRFAGRRAPRHFHAVLLPDPPARRVNPFPTVTPMPHGKPLRDLRRTPLLGTSVNTGPCGLSLLSCH